MGALGKQAPRAPTRLVPPVIRPGLLSLALVSRTGPRRLLRSGLFCWALAGVLCTSACGSSPSDETPTGALRLFLDAMERSAYEESALREAYGLLAPSARQQLRRRAGRASSLSHQAFEPWDMLPQGRFRLRFRPRRMRVEGDGDQVVVVVTGARDGERADVQMLLEEGRWRVVLAIPDVASSR